MFSNHRQFISSLIFRIHMYTEIYISRGRAWDINKMFKPDKMHLFLNQDLNNLDIR